MNNSRHGKKKKSHMSQEKLHALAFRIVSNALWALFLAIFLFVGILGAKKMYSFGYQVFAKETRHVASEELYVTIGEGSTTWEVASQLKENGLIDDAAVFVTQSFIFDLDVNPGTYTVNRNYTSRQLLEIFNNGPEG